MASSVQAYRITITNSSGGVAPANGFVDNRKIENYGLIFNTTPAGLSLPLCEAKRRGNVRYSDIINQLQMVANCYVDPNSFVSNATAIAEATSFSFHLYAEQGANSFSTRDELIPGVTLTGPACIKRCVARALATRQFKQIDIIDPTSTTSVGTKGATTSVVRFGARIYSAPNFEIGPYVSNLISGEALAAVVAI